MLEVPQTKSSAHWWVLAACNSNDHVTFQKLLCKTSLTLCAAVMQSKMLILCLTALQVLGCCLLFIGSPSEAEVMLTESLTILRTFDDKPIIALSKCVLRFVLFYQF